MDKIGTYVYSNKTEGIFGRRHLSDLIKSRSTLFQALFLGPNMIYIN